LEKVADDFHTKQTERFTFVLKNEVFWLGHSFALKMEAVESSETLANFYRATRCHVASISHTSFLFIMHPVPADNPIHHFRQRKGKSVTKECNILRHAHNEGTANCKPSAPLSERSATEGYTIDTLQTLTVIHTIKKYPR
jgi:hypothetical protein